MTHPTILLAAGEPSGDLHGAAVARDLRRRWPDARLVGLGGPRMGAAGVELLATLDRLAVMGFVEVAGRLPYLIGLYARLRRLLREERVDLVLPIDYPGFNLRLAREASRAGVPVLYYIAPQVWAWHRDRVRDIARYTDRLAVVLPFEEAWFREHGARARFVGHPLLDRPAVTTTRERFAEAVGTGPNHRFLAIFPGSRVQEVERHLNLFVAAADRIRRSHSGVQPVIARSDAVPEALYRSAPYPTTTDGRSLLAYADAALVKSGTTTLEAALARVPMVIAYRTHPVSFWFARRLVDVDHIGLVNLVAGRRVVPELVQHEATPAALADAASELLAAGPERSEVLERLEGVRRKLRPTDDDAGGAAERVGALAAELLARP